MRITPILILFLFVSVSSFAQSPSVDKEKLLDYYQTQRYADAAQYLQTVYPANTTDVRALGQIAYCYLMSGNLVLAEKRYLKIDSIQPNTLPVLFNLANINSRRGNRVKTWFYLDQIIKIDSNNFNALKQISNYTDSLDLKQKHLTKANQLNSSDADVATDLADVLVQQNQPLPAYKILQTAIDADTGNFILQKAVMPIGILLKKYKEVVIIGERLLANNASADVVKDLGKAYFFLKNYQKTISLYKMLEDMAMQNELTLYYTTIAYRELKNYSMATTYAKKTIEEAISPNTASYYSLLAGVYEANNQLTLSANAYKKGLTFSPNGNIYYRLGILYDLKLNKKANAISYYQLYLKSKPDLKSEKEQVDYAKARVDSLSK